MHMTTLEAGFEPTEVDVICSRGRTAFNHEGNVRFRGIVAQNVDKYKSAVSKQQKTAVVNNLLEEIQATTRFVRKQDDGKWVEVPEHVAKEKIGQGFRDLLHTEYRSSTKSKVKLRRERRRRQRSLADEGANTATSTTTTTTPTRGHSKSNSCETLEPLPLDEISASEEALIYHYPLAFVGQDERETAKDDVATSDNVDLPAEEPHGKTEVPENPVIEEDRARPIAEAQSHNAPTFVTPRSPPSRISREAAYHRRSHSLDSSAPAAGVSPARCPDSWEQYRRPTHLPPGSYTPPGYHPMQHYPPPYYSHSPMAYRGAPPLHPPPPPPPPNYYGSQYHPPPDTQVSSPRRPGWEPYRYGYPYTSPPRSRGQYASPYGSWGSEPAAGDTSRSPSGYHHSEHDAARHARAPEGQDGPAQWSSEDAYHHRPHYHYPRPPPPY